MLMAPSPLFGKQDVIVSAPSSIDPATLFGGAVKGAYYNFTDAASMAINADGTGGAPAIGGVLRSVLDKSPNGNRLRNTVNTATRRVNGIETAGVNYGLFNFTGYGDWPSIPQPFEVVVCFEQLAFVGTDARILAAGVNTPWYLLQGTASGKVRFFDSIYGLEVNPGLNAEVILDSYNDMGNSLLAVNGGAPASSPGNGQPLTGLFLASNSGGGDSTRIRFKHLLAIGRALTTAERAGVVAWMQA